LGGALAKPEQAAAFKRHELERNNGENNGGYDREGEGRGIH
jgi:hypothetical protein